MSSVSLFAVTLYPKWVSVQHHIDTGTVALIHFSSMDLCSYNYQGPKKGWHVHLEQGCPHSGWCNLGSAVADVLAVHCISGWPAHTLPPSAPIPRSVISSRAMSSSLVRWSLITGLGGSTASRWAAGIVIRGERAGAGMCWCPAATTPSSATWTN